MTLNFISDAAEDLNKAPAFVKNFALGNYSWGDGCELSRENGRKGYCWMKVINLLAAHSFG